MAIEMGKKYRTRDGRDVRILCVDGPGRYPVRGYLLPGGEPNSWTDAGNDLSAQKESNYDLIEISPYADIAIDAPGWARDEDSTSWTPCYFEGVGECGRPRAWIKRSYAWDEFTTTKPEGVV